MTRAPRSIAPPRPTRRWLGYCGSRWSTGRRLLRLLHIGARYGVAKFWGQRAKDLGTALDKKADTISYLAREGIRQRLEDEGFSGQYEALDEEMIRETSESKPLSIGPK